MKKDIENWEIKEGVNLLRRVGIAPGESVLDFGARIGNYSIPAARIVGKRGKVYALDKDSVSLDRLMKKAKKAGLDNIKRIDTTWKLKIPLKEKVSAILLYDVIHLVGKNDSSTRHDRKKLYGEIYNITGKKALISVYPTHLKTQTDITSREEVKKEIEEAGFRFKEEISAVLIHDENKERGYILNFRKNG